MPVIVKDKISRNAGHDHGYIRVQRIEGVTADGTWTADTLCVTADGRIVCIPAYVVEPASALDAFDAVAVAGGAVIDADLAEAAAASDIADAVSSVSADVVEATDAIDEIDAAVGAQVLFGTVDESADALDQLDAVVQAAEVPVDVVVGRYEPRRRPLPVVGYGYGILPELWGEAHGVVGTVGKSAAQIVVRAAAVGVCGQAGNAAVVFKALAVAGKGAVGTRGAGAGMIVKFSGSATGQHDDDEAAVLAFLLAA